MTKPESTDDQIRDRQAAVVVVIPPSCVFPRFLLDKRATRLHYPASMHVLAATELRTGDGIWVILGAAALYAGSRLAVEALVGTGPGRPGWRAVGHWMPIICVVLAAVLYRRAEVATGVVFATAVASLSLVMGILAFFSPLAAHPAGRRPWPFVLPAALLPLIAGFSGHLTWTHALMMLILGGAVWALWTDPAAREVQAGDFPFRDVFAAAAPAPADDAPAPHAGTNWLRLTVALVLAVVGGWAAVRGVVRTAESSRYLPAGMLAASVLSPVLTLPMLSTGSTLAQRGHGPSMAATLVGVVLLNLCALLPAAVILWHVAPVVSHYTAPFVSGGSANPEVPTPPTSAPAATPWATQPATGSATQPTTRPTTRPAVRPTAPPAPGTAAQAPATGSAAAMPYPLSVWRVDTVVLVVLGFVLVPVAMGRWVLGRVEAAGLIVGYAVYLALAMYVTGRGF